MLTKRSEKQLFFFAKIFEPRLGGGQKYSKNRSKSSNKWKCHEGWSLKTLRIGGVEHQESGDYLHRATEVISKRSD